ncbi:MAG: DUF5668 domain-containing protein [Acidobacteria bacterium]|nr:DUF5668 domain-containing protein [Acidobacteriota bacterium]
MCEVCRQPGQGTIFCAEHAPAAVSPAQASPWTSAAPAPSPANSSVSPGLAFILGWIPGVGAIYNGQYAKGLVHVVVIGLLISIQEAGAGGLEVLIGLMIALWFFYMAFEAYHTAKKRQLGLPVDEFSSLFPMRGAGGNSRIPIAPLALILLGVIFLLNNLEILRIHQLLKFWPAAMIALGVYLLYARLAAPSDHPAAAPSVPVSEVRHE